MLLLFVRTGLPDLQNKAPSTVERSLVCVQTVCTFFVVLRRTKALRSIIRMRQQKTQKAGKGQGRKHCRRRTRDGGVAVGVVGATIANRVLLYDSPSSSTKARVLFYELGIMNDLIGRRGGGELVALDVTHSTLSLVFARSRYAPICRLPPVITPLHWRRKSIPSVSVVTTTVNGMNNNNNVEHRQDCALRMEHTVSECDFQNRQNLMWSYGEGDSDANCTTPLPETASIKCDHVAWKSGASSCLRFSCQNWEEVLTTVCYVTPVGLSRIGAADVVVILQTAINFLSVRCLLYSDCARDISSVILQLSVGGGGGWWEEGARGMLA